MGNILSCCLLAFHTDVYIRPNPELKRRTQQYGHLFSYRYRYKNTSKTSHLFNNNIFRKVLQEYGPFPSFCNFFVDRIIENNWMDHKPNHLLVNEYNPGQGIMSHIGNM